MRLLSSLFLLGCVLTIAQPGTDSPWMEQLRKQKNGELTYQEMVDAGNAYWATHDKDAKGSGYKPFMRWVDAAKAYVKEDGTIQNVKDLREILDQRATQKSALNDLSNWSPLGPFTTFGTGSWSTGQGRTNTMIVDPNNSNTYYLGAPAGGIWKSTDAGVNWAPLSDFLAQIGVSAIAIDPTDSNVIYIGTGDDDASDSASIGLMKSTDGGQTWNHTGLLHFGNSANISEIYLDPRDNNKIFVSSNLGFYRSTDGGATFTITQFGNVKDIKLKPGAPDTIYLSTANSFFISTNNGVSFTQQSTGLPSGMRRSVIAVTPANPNYVYLLIINSSADLMGLYRSTNSGLTFTRRDNGTDILESRQGNFDLALEVSPTNAELVYTGCLNIWRSFNGGSVMSKVNDWDNPTGVSYTHADIHQIRQFGSELFVMSDGGIYRSTNFGNNFTDLTSGAQIGQFYRIAVSSQSSNQLMGGLQDNGGKARSTNLWKNFYGADGMDGGIDPTNDNIRYGFIQNGGTLYFTNNGGNSRQQAIARPSGESGNWITPLKTDSQGTIYVGYTRLYKVQNNSFVTVSPSINSTISVIEIDPTNDNIIYLGVNNFLHKSTNAGANFSIVSAFSQDISSIEVSNNDSNIIYVSTDTSFGQVLKSSTQGTNFVDITGNLPNLGKNTLASLPSSIKEDLFVGTTVGVYKYDDVSAQWSLFNNNLPNVNIRDLEINGNDNILTAATYGRGIWQTGLSTVLSNQETINRERYRIYPNPSNGNFTLAWNGDLSFDYSIYDVSGKLITSKNNNTGSQHFIELNGISQGMYFLNIKTATGTVTEKLLIK